MGPRVLMAILVSILMTAVAMTVVAQSHIQVVEDRAIVDFPEAVEFMVALNGDAQIDTVTLNYGTNAVSCSPGGSRQPLDFDPDQSLELEWLWDLKRSGAVPPGAEIWWQWEIEDENSNLLTTERQSTSVIDDRHTWQTISNSNVTVRWYEGNRTFGQSVLTLAVDSLARLSREAGVTMPDQVQLWIYPSASAIREAVINTSEWAGGVAFPDYGTTLIGLSPGEDEWAAEVIPHELAHLVVGTLVQNCRGSRLPTWLSEGLAVFSSGGNSPAELVRLENSLSEDRLVPLHSLARGFSAYAGGADMAYVQSAEVVHYLIEAHGPEQMAALLDQIQNGQHIDEALAEVYGFDTDGLDADWRISRGFEARSLSAEDQARLEATPTLVPTLALGGIPVAATPTAPPAETETAAPAASAMPTSTSTRPPTATSSQLAEAVPTMRVTLAATEMPSLPETEETAGPSGRLILAGTGLIILLFVVLVIWRLNLRPRGG